MGKFRKKIGFCKVIFPPREVTILQVRRRAHPSDIIVKVINHDRRLPFLKQTLKKYEAELEQRPNSLFAKGMVKNTRELINEIEKP